ncbi:uncharacterized protein TRAVEDRAFT_63907, partial [Trametes versicolor FP-101664 SS1]|uniref:uncharacterized protein n=1 Tax=Trametes versicolor (strain FP-101664) TaxID=717944 RepID=UPI0004621566
MKLKMIVDICSSINHLERMKFHVELQHDDRGTHSLKSYAIRADEIMYDSSNGGRFKWVRDPSKPRDARYQSYGSMLSGPPLTGANRKALVERLKPISHEDADPHEVAATWFWLVQTYPWIVNMGRGMCDVRPYSPQGIAQVGEWLALDRGTPGWSNVVVDEEIRTSPVFTTGLSVLGSPAAEQTTPVNEPLKRTFGALTGYDKQTADCELTHDVRVGGMRWTRYLVRCMPVGTTFMFLQALDPDGTGDVSKAIRAVAAAASSDFRTMGIVTGRQYLFDTTLTHTADPAHKVPDSLWFFVLRRDRDQGVDHRCSTPWAFWSTEREPAEIPPNVTFNPTPRFEPLSKKPENPVFAWTQVLDGMTFSIQATVFHRFTMLTEDEILALRQLSVPDDSQRAYWDEMQGHARIEEVPECASDEPQNKRWLDMPARNSRTCQIPSAGTP